jgi:hypothetical protein
VPPTPAPVETQVIVAKIERLAGEVFVLAPNGRAAAVAGQELPAGVGIECGERSFAVLSYPDRTRVEVTGNTVVRDLFDAKGKQLFVEKGAVKAEIAKQPKDKPMIFGMPHGEAKVLGTVLRLSVDPKSSNLEVEEGKVELRNSAGRTIDVPAGRMATAAAGTTLSTKSLPADEGLVSLDFEDGTVEFLLVKHSVEGRKELVQVLRSPKICSGSPDTNIDGHSAPMTKHTPANLAAKLTELGVSQMLNAKKDSYAKYEKDERCEAPLGI